MKELEIISELKVLILSKKVANDWNLDLKLDGSYEHMLDTDHLLT